MRAITPFLSLRGLCALGLVFSVPARAADAPPWDYNSDSESWAFVSQVCAKGIEQSPIDIDSDAAVPAALPALAPKYGKAALTVELTPPILRLVPPKGQFLMLGKERYELEEITVHTPGEHTIDFKQFPVELQWKHRGPDGKILYLALLADNIGTDNAALAPLLKALTPSAKPAAVTLSLSSLLPKSLGYYRYDGSLTTPPCTEGVNWLVFKNPILLSPSQLRTLAGALGRNAREIQKRAHRIVEQSKD